MGGFSISRDELKRVLGTAGAPRLVDVRSRSSFDADGYSLPAARWRDPQNIESWIGACSNAVPIIAYCEQGGAGSQRVAATLRRAGLDASYLDGGFEGWTAQGGLRINRGAFPNHNAQLPTRWVTRVRPKIDRIACPWLISRFIDCDAEFYFVNPDQVVAVAEALQGIPYDIEGVDFGHDGDLCTFDTLLDRFGLDDPALKDLATIVRGADTARLDLAPEAAGLLAVSLGNSVIAGADDRTALAMGFPVYDALLAWRRHAAAETHNWPAKGK